MLLAAAGSERKSSLDVNFTTWNDICTCLTLCMSRLKNIYVHHPDPISVRGEPCRQLRFGNLVIVFCPRRSPYWKGDRIFEGQLEIKQVPLNKIRMHMHCL